MLALQAVNSHEFGDLRHNPRCERSHGLHEALEFRPSQAEANASMPSVAEIVGGHGEPLGPGFTGISNQNLAREAVASRRAILLYACRLLLGASLEGLSLFLGDPLKRWLCPSKKIHRFCLFCLAAFVFIFLLKAAPAEDPGLVPALLRPVHGHLGDRASASGRS